MILAADVGGTNIRAALVTCEGDIVDEVPARMPMGDRNILENDLIERLVSFFNEIIKNNKDIKAVGMGFPGFFIENSGILIASPNLPRLHNAHLAEKLSQHLKLPTYVQNDALCAAIGEHRFGAGKGVDKLLHITLGTGIGGGLIMNHTPYTGEGGMAMEFGHLCVVRDGSARACGCGNKGCVEAYASATAIAAQYFTATGTQSDTKDMYARACDGDSEAKRIIESAGSYLGMGMAEAVKLLDIRTISISGGLAGAWPLLHPAMLSALNTHLIPPLKHKINVLRSTLNDHAGILGAAALVD
ncbi:MAG: ROK family protein [Mariprofundaceae bacterium]